MNLKKVTALAAALCLCMVFGMSAFAAGSPSVDGSASVGSPSVDNNTSGIVLGTFTENGKTIEIFASPEAADPAAVEALNGKVAELKNAGYEQIGAIYNLQMRGGSVKEGPLGQSVSLDLKKLYLSTAFDASNKDYILVHATHTTNGYSVITHDVSANGTVTVDSLCPVVLMSKTVSSDNGNNNTNSNGSNNNTSPKTGENGMINMLGVLAVVSGAGVVLSRKKK